MEKKEKNEMLVKSSDDEQDVKPEISADDFQFVQLNASIHDQKFKTKPTTFFKDAMKRFVKNRSSVVAGCILGIIIGMAIFVPIVDQNDIVNPSSTAAYLPPKWAGIEVGTGFLDGTKDVTDVIVDRSTGYPIEEAGYVNRSIVHGKEGISTKQGFYNVLSDVVATYGQGGDVLIRTDSLTDDAGISSPRFNFYSTDDYTLAVGLDAEACAYADSYSPSYAIQLGLDENSDGVYEDVYTIKAFSSDYKDVTLSFTGNDVLAAFPLVGTGCKASLIFTVKTSGIQNKFPALYIKSVAVADSTRGTSDTTFAYVNFTDATEMLGRSIRDSSLPASQGPYVIAAGSSASLNIFKSEVVLGSFRYDCYDAAYGEDTYTFNEDEISQFIANGWISYTWTGNTANGEYDIDPQNFSLTSSGETYSPIQGVQKEIVTSFRGDISRAVVCTRSLYRFDYWKGYISKCVYPTFIFGTNAEGKDYFKLAFAGLRTSLALGFLCAAINITFGIIWGAISGYFGGWTDIVMERFTEILGGIPWIVLMTLIVLHLGSSFGTFLLALCLTGWMGVASETRSQFYRYKGREYVLASRTLGASDWRLIFRHILPNGIGPVVTGSVLIIPGVIFSEATISYLLPGTLQFKSGASFGLALEEAQGELGTHPYMIIAGSLIMAVLMICFNLFGNGLRDAFNPSLKGVD